MYVQLQKAGWYVNVSVYSRTKYSDVIFNRAADEKKGEPGEQLLGELQRNGRKKQIMQTKTKIFQIN